LLSACREDFIYNIDPEEEKVNFVSELNPSLQVTALITKSISLNSNMSQADIEKAVILFSGTDLPSRQTSMIYIPQDDNFALRSFDFRPSPGNSYEVIAYIPDSDIDTIRAFTRMPRPVSIRKSELLKMEKIRLANNKVDYKITVGLTLAQPVQRPSYIQIVPFRRKSTYRTDINGNILITNTNELSSMTINGILTANNGVIELEHKPGVYIDYSRVNGDEIQLELVTSRALDDTAELIKILEFEVNTLSEELYLYHINLSRQISGSRADFSAPVKGYTNVENGFGVFGSYSTLRSTLEL
jgi:hypothetical protein